MKTILYIALMVGFVNGFFWRDLPKGSFYVLNAIFIVLLCLFIFLCDRKSFIKFVLLSLSCNNLCDELFFTATKIGVNEILFALILPIVWLLKKNRICLIKLFRKSSRNYS